MKFDRSQEGFGAPPALWLMYVCIETKWLSLTDSWVNSGVLLCHKLRLWDSSSVRQQLS